MSRTDPLYIFDLDGTLADQSHRFHLIEQTPKRWDEYFRWCVNDEPIDATIRVLQALLDNGADVRIWSARSDMVEAETIAWLGRHVDTLPWMPGWNLLMRPAHDHCQDDELKRRWLEALDPTDRKRLVAAFEDRDRVVGMWRAAGVTCYQVAPGGF